MSEPVVDETQPVADNVWPDVVDLEIRLPNGKTVALPAVNVTENLTSVRQALAEFQETAFLTCFTWKLVEVVGADGEALLSEPTEASEFPELNSFLVDVSAKKLVLEVVPALYDAKKARQHVKRLRDTLLRPFLLSASTSPQSRATEGEVKGSEEQKSSAIPSVDQLASSDLSQYFDKIFLTETTAAARNVPASPLLNAIKSVAISGWNPVPAHRRQQGDLLYVEVSLAAEGSIYLTATSRGFFVNKSNRTHFDASPANHAHFYHSIFDTLCALSSNVRSAWQLLVDASQLWAAQSVSGALDAVASQVSTFSGDAATLPASTWLMPSDSLNSTKYDMLRAQEAAADLAGVEELGAPREWNDELQSIRSLQASDLNSQILKARLEHRMITEFTEFCRKAVVAIADGIVSPLTYSDPAQSDIFVYNGVFFSRSEDSKDTLHYSPTGSKTQSEESARKCAGRDLSNQKLLRSLEIPGLGTILCAIVDYKGTRYVGQSIIPGIFVQGEQRASLLYGVLERGKSATIKNESLKLFEQLADKLHLAKRRLPVVPFALTEEESNALLAAQDGVVADSMEAREDALTALLKSAETSASPIKVDDVDNVPVDADGCVPHCGPIEAKLIQGTDGRTYALEVMRLTPRDANYISEQKGGSARIAESKIETLENTDSSILQTYVLRQELVRIFLLRKVNLQRQTLLSELAGKEKQVKEHQAESKEKEATAAVEDASDDEEDGDHVEIVKKEASENQDVVIDEALASEYREKFSAITVESLGLKINPNVFLDSIAVCGADSAQRTEDEALVREISTFLIDSVLPMLTRQVREGDVSPKDNESLVSLLHRMGVNMRYLGKLSELAMDQEREDAELMFQNRQRVHSMPYFWLELLQIELLARSAKHLLNAAMKKDQLVADSPAQTIAAMLNRFLDLLRDPSQPAADSEIKTVGAVDALPDKKKSDKSNKKQPVQKGKATTTTNAVALSVELSFDSNVADDFSSSEKFASALQTVLFDKFLHESPLLLDGQQVPEEENKDESDAAKEERDRKAWRFMHAALLRSRLSASTLLRRICQQCGIVLVVKNYELDSLRAKEEAEVESAVNKKSADKQQKKSKKGDLFSAADVLCLQPKVKSCEPDAYLAQLPEMLSSSATLLSQGNAVAAFEVAQQALNIVSQITGPAHLHALQATEQLANVLVNSADDKSSAQMCTRMLSLSSQVQGLDNQSVVFQHVQLAMLESEFGNMSKAFDHLTTARYLLEIIGGAHHPDMIIIYNRLSFLYEKINDLESALQCLLRARMFVYDLLNNAGITSAIAQLLFKSERFHEAKNAQTSAYKIFKELLSPTDERVVEAKKQLEVYIRSAAAAPKLSMSAEELIGSLTQAEREKLLAAAAAAGLQSPAALLGGDAAGKKKKKRSKAKK